jgi:hypothetical protein
MILLSDLTAAAEAAEGRAARLQRLYDWLDARWPRSPLTHTAFSRWAHAVGVSVDAFLRLQRAKTWGHVDGVPVTRAAPLALPSDAPVPAVGAGASASAFSILPNAVTSNTSAAPDV